jgi:hypothetical protein
MAQTTMNVRIDENVKKSFDEFCADVGLNASVAINMFVRAVYKRESSGTALSGWALCSSIPLAKIRFSSSVKSVSMMMGSLALMSRNRGRIGRLPFEPITW